LDTRLVSDRIKGNQEHGMTMRDLESAAMKLPTVRRAQLAASLLASLDQADESEIDHAWAQEADRRLRRHGRAKSKTIPAAIAIAKARDALR
jgi:putative addiction module component (TIGR02574 family)